MAETPEDAVEKRRQLLAQRLARRKTALHDGISSQQSTFADISFVEERLCFLDELEGPSSTYSVAAAMRVEGPLDVERMTWCLHELCRRHSVFRSCYRYDGEGYRRFEAENVIDLEVIASTRLDTDTVDYVYRQAALAFDITTGPLFRVRLIEEAEGSWVLFFAVHHLIADGQSVALLLQELSALYADDSELNAREGLGEVPPYHQYVRWACERLDGHRMEDLLEYWVNELAGVEQYLDLPFDQPVSEHGQGGIAELRFEWSSERYELIRAVALRTNTTPFVVLLTLYQLLLARMTNQWSFAVGVPVANRPIKQLERVIGAFVNSVPIPVRLNERLTFQDMLSQTRRAVIGAVDHEELPFDRLVQELRPVRRRAQNPLFQAWFVMHGRSVQDFTLPGMTIKTLKGSTDVSMTDIELRTGSAKFDCALSFEENRTGYVGLFEYPNDRFSESTIQRFVTVLDHLAESLLVDPTQSVAQLLHNTADVENQSPSVRDGSVVTANAAYEEDWPVRHELEFGPAAPIAFSQWGSSGPLCLLIHGLGHNGRVWDEVANSLMEQQLKVLAPDLLGHGASGWATDGQYSVDLWATSVVHLVKTIAFPGPIVIIGHSLGAHIAAAVYEGIRESVAGMILVDIPFDPVEPDAYSEIIPGGRRFSSTRDFEEALASTHPLADPTVVSRLAEYGSKPAPGMGVVRTDDPAIYENAPFSDPLDDLRLLRSIRAPTLVVRGALSGRLRSDTARWLVSDVLRDGTVVSVDGAGHGAHVDAPTSVASCISSFLKELLPSDD